MEYALAAGIVALMAGGLLGWRALIAGFRRRYYQLNYAPIALPPQEVRGLSPEHHLDDVP